MNARLPYTSRQRRDMARVCEKVVGQNLDDAVKRSQYLWAMSMLAAGLSPATVNRVKNKLPAVTAKYADYRTDQLADYVFCTKLQQAGVDVEMTEGEL